MTKAFSSRSLLRFGSVVTLALVTAACASSGANTNGPASSNTAQAPQESQSAQMLRYCDSLRKSGDLNIAAGMCRRAYEADPTNRVALHRLGQILTELGQVEGAARVYHTAMTTDPQDNEARYNLAKIYMKIDRLDLAAAQLQTAIEQNPDDPRFYNVLGVIRDQEGKHQEAQAIYREGLAAAPQNVALKNNLALSMGLSGQKDESIAMLQDLAQEPAAAAVASDNLAFVSGLDDKPAVETQSEIVTAEAPKPTARPQALVAQAPAEAVAQPEPQPEPQSQAPITAATAPAPAETAIDATVIENEGFARDLSAEQTPGFEIDSSLAAAPKPLVEETADIEVAAAETAVEAPESAPEPEADPEPASSLTLAGSATTSAAPAAEPQVDNAVIPAASAKLPSEIFKSQEPEAEAPIDSASPAENQVAALPSQEAAPETESETAAPRITRDANGQFLIQVGSYLHPEDAEKGWQIISDDAPDLLDGFEPQIVEADAGEGKGIVYRLRTGPLASREDGNRLCASLTEQGHGCFTVQAAAEDQAAPPSQAEVPATSEPASPDDDIRAEPEDTAG